VLVPTQTSGPANNGGGNNTEPQPGPEPLSPTLTPVPDQRQQLSIAVDARTNTLIVSGTDEYLKRVEMIVTDLDGKKGNERESRVFALRNVKAKEVEATLQSYFKGESDKQHAVLGPDQSGSALRQLEQEVTVVGDEKSNKLVISTSPRYMDMVLSMVKELDATPPQVVIQVLLAEVSTDSSGQWGVDITGRGLTGLNATAQSLAAGAGVAAALGVPNLTFVLTDLELIVRALQAQGKLQILSSPYLQARNNEKASIQVGDNIAIVSGNVERTPQGGTVSSVDRKDTGVILNVTPSISPDGFVRMEVAPEISQLSSQTTQITQDFQAPILTQRKLSTTVTVKDGQTVVIGGLMQTINDQRRTKVPLLGDIPVVGWLFRSVNDSDKATELLVILTPKVIYGDSPESLERLDQIANEKIDGTQAPYQIRDNLERNNFYEQSKDLPLTPTAPPPQPAPVPEAAPPQPAPQPAASDPSPPHSDIYVPPKSRRSSFTPPETQP
jgi:general secretion pathway protein D